MNEQTMKQKMKVLVMVFVAALAFCACDDDDNDNIKVPDAVSRVLYDKYPNVYDVEWERKGSYLVADCKQKGADMDVWFSAQGEWLLTETEVYKNELPTAVLTAFEHGEYATWRWDDADKLEYAGLAVQYVIEVEQGRQEVQLFYSETGDLLKTKDVTGQDDTHWPVTNR